MVLFVLQLWKVKFDIFSPVLSLDAIGTESRSSQSPLIAFTAVIQEVANYTLHKRLQKMRNLPDCMFDSIQKDLKFNISISLRRFFHGS